MTVPLDWDVGWRPTQSLGFLLKSSPLLSQSLRRPLSAVMFGWAVHIKAR